ncbi:hypothetical protein [Antarcticimicrobium sediminis]|uniref:Uncharacterized protein n=1 Tax=Antarcticimicrobium sediminis TaxID=2546227 RepID=A0A4V2Z843_9RHOB|nr:hypothetical protein [Antarcticimicrobium sediminis]TDE38936.1 hypothetical protein E1B25_07920 [Antarcticimicrobium sediminis]
MNSIVFTDFVTPASGASRHNTALGRFGTWFDAEIGNLEDLLDISGHEDAIDDLEVLHALQLDADATPDDVGRLLSKALASLERLLERVRTIPIETAGPASSDLDVWVCTSRIRLEDIVAALRDAQVVRGGAGVPGKRPGFYHIS